jgi:hypothetical protein
MTLNSDRPGTLRLYLVTFVFFFMINLITSGGHLDLWDGMVAFLITESMALKHTAQLHPEIPRISEAKVNDAVHTMMDYEIGNYKILIGKYYEWVSESRPQEPVFASKSLLLPAVSVPFYLIANLLSLDPLTIIGLSVNSLIISLTSLVIFCFSFDLYESRRIAFVLGIVFLFSSFILPYNNTLFPQPLQSLCLITAAYFLYKSRHISNSFICTFTQQGDHNNIRRGMIYSGLASVFLGMSVFASPVSIIFIPVFIICSFLFLRYNKKLITSFLLSLAIMIFLVGVVNYLRFESFTEFGYGGGYGTLSYNQGWTGLLGLLASPGKGLIIYFPLVIVFPIALKYIYRKDKGFFLLTTFIVFASWLYFGTLEANNESRFWSGAIAWGPRYLIPLLPFITITLGALLERLRFGKTKWTYPVKAALIALLFAGIIINLPGSLVWSEYGTMYAWEKERLGGGALEIMTWNPNYSPIILHLKVLSEDYVSDIPVDAYRYSAWYYAAYGLAPCQYDFFIFCTLGIIPVVILGGVAVILAIIILKGGWKGIHVYS